jgi:hypothetical protein
VFTKWGTVDRKVHNTEVRDATAFLIEHIIPAFAKKIESDPDIFGYEQQQQTNNTHLPCLQPTPQRRI